MDDSTEAQLREWIGRSEGSFDILACEKSQLPPSVEILDSRALDRHFRYSIDESLGSIPMRRVAKAYERIAIRISHKLAQSHSKQLDISIAGLRAAWFQPIYSELTTLLPIRHLARKLARRTDLPLFAIPLRSLSFLTANAWSTNEMEPLYLAYEMRRQKVPVFLFIDDPGDTKLTFTLSKASLPKDYPQFRYSKRFTEVLGKTAVRRPEYVSRRIEARRRRKPGLLSRQRRLGFSYGQRPIELGLDEGPSFGPIRSYFLAANPPGLEQGFVDQISPLSVAVANWFRGEFEGRSIERANIADHASFESGIMAAEVLRKGGGLFLWPHSANAVHTNLHSPDDVVGITVAAQSTGRFWAESFGHSKINVDPAAILPSAQKAAGYSESHPIHVVLFAGAHALKRMPLLDIRSHEETWALALRSLQSTDSELTIKHKTTWESRDWIRRLAPDPNALKFSDLHANKLSHPNMLFLSISMTSTAILEGIARGIPGMVVRDMPVEETPYYDPHCIPIVPSQDIATRIQQLNSKAAWESLSETQNQWFIRETKPD